MTVRSALFAKSVRPAVVMADRWRACRPLLALGLALLLPGAASAAQPVCAEWAKRLPNVDASLCTEARLQDSGARSLRGRALLVRDLAPTLAALPGAGLSRVAASATAPLRVLVVGGIHGDELSASALALHWLHLASQQSVWLPSAGAGSSEAGARAVHWRFIPALNPDGLLSQPPQRTNAAGVDLNRNFPTPRWAQEAPLYWQQRTRRDPRRWPGAKPLSEPESRYLHDQLLRFAPHLIVSIHAPYGVLDFDGPKPGVPPPRKLGRLYLDQVGIFPGSLGNYAGVHKGVPVVTIELPNALRTPTDAEIGQMWLDLQRWMREHLIPANARHETALR